MDEEKKQNGCTGRCENCNETQRVYCAAQIGLYNQKEIASIKEKQEKIIELIEGITRKEEISTIQEISKSCKKNNANPPRVD